MAIDEYSDWDGLDMAAHVRRGEVSAVELVDEAIQRAEALNPKLNAIVYEMFDHARKLAASPPPGTFAGVPLVLKDMTAHYAGTPPTHGSRLLADVSPSVGMVNVPDELPDMGGMNGWVWSSW